MQISQRSKRSNYFQKCWCEGVKLWWKFTTNFWNSSWCLVVFPPNKHTRTGFCLVWLRFSFKNRFESASGTVLRSLFAPWWLQQNEEDKEASVPWFIGWLQPVEAHIGGYDCIHLGCDPRNRNRMSDSGPNRMTIGNSTKPLLATNGILEEVLHPKGYCWWCRNHFHEYSRIYYLFYRWKDFWTINSLNVSQEPRSPWSDFTEMPQISNRRIY